MKRVLYEACVEDVSGALAAQAGGADRVELCERLDVGGTSPSRAALEAARAGLEIPLVALVRPRPGDFVYTHAELDRIRAEITAVKSIGLWGIAVGVLRKDGTIDADAMDELIRLARPLRVTFHRAFDDVPDRLEALEDLIRLGVDRILTSGGARDALSGRESLAKLVERAGERTTILAAGGIRSSNVAEILAATGAREVHGRAPGEGGGTSSAEVRALVDALAR